jgi:nicotinamidase-related amidase
MPAKNPDLHGNVPEHCRVALLIIDVINDMEFPGGDVLFPHALQAAGAIASLKRRCAASGIPTIYVNDNFGRWKSDFNKIVDHCAQDGVRGKPLTELLRPGEKDYFVLKPKHSGFFSTTLDILLDYLGARTLIMTGVTADICVLFTANDAYMRDFNLVIPSDCVASLEPAENRHAIKQMQTVLKADVTVSNDLDLGALLREDGVQSRSQSP